MTSPFYLAQPWWGLLALLPLLLFGWHHWRVSRLAQDYCAPQLMPFMRLTQDSWRGLPWRWLAIWMLLVVALCQPKWVNEDAQAQQRPIQWVALVDLSDSMQAQDVQPSRLQHARWLLEATATHWQQDDKVGLIAFSASHHWLMPLTADKALWQAQLNLLEANLLPLRGSLLQHTMAEVDKQLPANVGVLVVTDGGGIDVTQSAQRLSHPALMVVLGQGAAALPPSVADGAGVDVGVPVSKVKRLAHDWGIEWVRGEQASLDIASWLAQQRDDAAVVSGAHSTQQDRDLSAFVLLLALVVWLNFWRFLKEDYGGFF
jgi:Ca-activated chloride channel family protein